MIGTGVCLDQKIPVLYLCAWKAIYRSETWLGPSASWTRLGAEGAMEINFWLLAALMSTIWCWTITLPPPTHTVLDWNISYFLAIYYSVGAHMVPLRGFLIVSSRVTVGWLLWPGCFPEEGHPSSRASPGTAGQSSVRAASLLLLGSQNKLPRGNGQCPLELCGSNSRIFPTPIPWSQSLIPLKSWSSTLPCGKCQRI